MITVRSIGELHAALAPGRRDGLRLGLVATMGSFHDGHLSLMRHAVDACDAVVVSLFVNPRQFDDPSDLAAYPRDERDDAELAAGLGVDYLFVPSVGEMYPDGFATTVSVSGVSEPLEGAARGAGHFAGVATVVCKLLGIVSPDVAYFGRKDAQQAAVIRRMVTDLNIRSAIETLPTVRAPDGLALSSRNARLSELERERAVCLHRALEAVQAAIASGERDPERATESGRAELDAAGAEVEYLELVDPGTMLPVSSLEHDALAVVAARVGAVRLIDNLPISPQHPLTHHLVATPLGAPTA